MGVQRFYDELADHYHALYPDWEQQLTDQARSLAAVLGNPVAGATVADSACGIGTQLIGLAALGYTMFGNDISPAAVARARTECADRGLDAQLVVADMRALPWPEATMDAAVCADNAIPHLLTDQDVTTAFTELARVLRPGARVAITTRDYDEILRTRPSGTPPQVMDHTGRERVISFQLWGWRGTSDIYDLEHFQLSEDRDGGWVTTSRTATYRAYERDHLSYLAIQAGLTDIRWLTAIQADYFQPVMLATRPT